MCSSSSSIDRVGGGGNLRDIAASSAFGSIKEFEHRRRSSSRVIRSRFQVLGPRPVMKATAGGSGGLLLDDQLQQIFAWFDNWNDCERTDVLYKLLARLAPPQGRFLWHCIHKFHANSFELPLLENRANSSEYLESLHGVSPETVASHLLQHLPLLRPGDDEIRARYLGLVQEVLSHASRTGTLYAECQQILTYSLMHPAFSAGDQKALQRWTQRFDDCYGGLLPATAINTTGTSNGHSNGCVRLSNGPNHQQQGQSQMQVIHQQQQSNAANKSSSTYAAQPPTCILVQQTVPISRLDNWTNGANAGEAAPPHSPPSLVSPSSADSMLRAFNSDGNVRSSIELHCPLTTSNTTINQLARHLNDVSFYTPQLPQLPSKNDSMINLGKPYCNSSSQGPSDGFLNGRAKRSNSLTPPSSSTSPQASSMLNGCKNAMPGNCNGNCIDDLARMKPRSMSLSLCSGPCSGPLSPQNGLGVSGGFGSEVQLDGSFSFDNAGMKGVPAWLKGLRLHKYTYLFSGLAYNEIFEMTEVSLAARDVTQGARTKILVNIQKLRDRPEKLRSIEMDILGAGPIRKAFEEFGSILDSPLIPFQPDSYADECDGDENMGNDSDLPGQITRLFEKISMELLQHQLENDIMHQFLEFIDKCLKNEAFTESQKTRLKNFSQLVGEKYRSLVPRRGSDYRHNRGPLTRPYGSNGFFNGVADFRQLNKCNHFVAVPSSSSSHNGNHNFPVERRGLSRSNGHHVISTKSLSTEVGNYFNPEQQQRRSAPDVLVSADISRSPPSPPIQADYSPLMNGQLSMPNLFNKRGSLQENNSHRLLVHTKSAPNAHNQYQLFGNGKSGGSGLIGTENDFMSGLESVSRSVTEHALGDSG